MTVRDLRTASAAWGRIRSGNKGNGVLGNGDVLGNGKTAGTRTHHFRWSPAPAAVRLLKGHTVKALGLAAAAVMAFAPLTAVVVVPGVAEAAPCAGAGSNPVSCAHCRFYVSAYHTANVCDSAPAPRPAPSPTLAPVQIPPLNLPPEPPPSVVPTTAAPPTSVGPQTPTISPPGAGSPRVASVVPPPKGLDAPPPAVAAARAATATKINPGSPPPPPMQVYDFGQRVQNVVDAHSGNIDLVKVGSQMVARPRHWDYIEYDDYGRPTLFNPLEEAMSFRYFYDGAYREVFVPSGGRIVIDGAAPGLFPFTAVGESHLAAGSFFGGAVVPKDAGEGKPPPDYKLPTPPAVYPDVLISVPADNQTVQVGQVEVIGRDEHQAPGSQDTFLLDDSTLAWGQINDPAGTTQIRVTKTQPLPGYGPTDNGTYLVALATRSDLATQPAPPAKPWWPSVLGYGSLAVVLILVFWFMGRRSRSAEDNAGL